MRHTAGRYDRAWNAVATNVYTSSFANHDSLFAIHGLSCSGIEFAIYRTLLEENMIVIY